MAKKALGRGLGAIIGDVEEAYNQEFRNSNDEIVKEINVDDVTPNPYQPRTHFDEKALKELSKSIKKHGLLQPILVVEKDDGYMLLAGERRLRASKLAGLEKVKAIVADIESQNLRELALIENIQRENLNPIELAIAYKELIEEYDITQEGLSEIILKSRTQITNTMRLLTLSKRTQKLISEGKFSQGHAKVIVGLSEEDEKTVVDTVLGQKLSVRETEAIVKRIKSGEKAKTKVTKKQPSQIMEKLGEELKNDGYKIKIKSNSLTLNFTNDEQIEEFLKKLKLS